MPDIKKQKILDGDWDHLIILDACRYDVFKESYRKYPSLKEGKLKKRKSRGSSTSEWLHKTFTKTLPNTIYISANPFINNRNLTLKETTTNYNKDWNPTENFKKVVDIWDKGWDKETTTVLPREVNKEVKKHLDHRQIIHYIQPHTPFIPYVRQTKKTKGRDKGKKEDISIYAERKSKFHQLLKELRPDFIWKRLSVTNRWKIRKLVGDRLDPFAKAYIDSDLEQLKEYYRKNLEIALQGIENILPHLKGKIVITADHGEAFGEQGEWKHPTGSDNPVLREVPWLEINKEKTEKSRIKGKIKDIR